MQNDSSVTTWAVQCSAVQYVLSGDVEGVGVTEDAANKCTT